MNRQTKKPAKRPVDGKVDSLRRRSPPRASSLPTSEARLSIEPDQQRLAGTVFDSIESAAVKLGVEVDALRARCRRAKPRPSESGQVHLGGGIIAFKFGSSWRIRFPPS